MGLKALGYGVLCLLAAGCANAPAGSADTDGSADTEVIGRQESALSAVPTAAAASPSAADGYRLEKPDPDALRRPTGARLPTKEEKAHDAARSLTTTSQNSQRR